MNGFFLPLDWGGFNWGGSRGLGGGRRPRLRFILPP